MSGVDDRIVEMKFDNRQFESGVESTIQSLDRLKASLNFGNVSNGLADLENSANNITLDGMSSSLDNISSKFSAMGAIGFTAIQSLTNSAIDAGKKMGHALLSPIIEGGKRRALALEQARFQFKGLGLDVEKTMAVALKAVEGTAYGLDAAATVAAQFGASGMKAGTEMTGALRGIAGVAAMTGTSYEDIGQIFTSVAGQGKLMGTQLMQLSSRGVNGAAILAKQMGKTEAQIRTMTTNGEISFREFASAMDDAFGKHAKSANKTFEGALSNMKAALSRLGAAFAAPSFEALRKVFNGLTPVIDKVKKGLEPLVVVFTRVVNVVSRGLVRALEGLNFANFNRSMKAFADGVRNIFWALVKVFGAFKAAFKEVFRLESGKGLVEFARTFRTFTEGLRHGGETLAKFKRIFAGFFAVIAIAWKILSGVTTAFLSLFGAVGKGSGGFLEVAASVGDALVAFNNWLSKGDKIKTVLDGIASAIAPVVGFVAGLAGAFATLLSGDVDGFFEKVGAAFSAFTTGAEGATGIVGSLAAGLIGVLTTVGEFLAKVGGGIFAPISGMIETLVENIQTLRDKLTLKPTFDASGLQTGVEKTQELSLVGTVLVAIWKGAVAVLKGVWAVMKGFSAYIRDIIGDIKSWMEGLTFEDILAIVNTGLFILLYRQLSQFVGGLNNITGSIKDWAKTIDTITRQGFNKLTDALKTMQNNVRANIILKIAIAIAILAGAIFLLSKIEPAKLAIAIGAITTLFAELMASLYTFSKLGPLAEIGMTKIAGTLVLLAAAVYILASAVEKLGRMKWQEMLTGLGAVGALLGALLLFTRFAKVDAAAQASGAGLLLMAGAIYILSLAVGRLGEMSDKGNLIQGIGAIGALLLVMAGTMVFLGKMKKGIEKGAGSILVMSIAVLILSKVVKTLGEMKGGDLIKGVGAIAVLLIVLAGAMLAFASAGALGAMGILAAAGSIAVIAGALALLGQLSIGQIVTGILTLTVVIGALVALAIALEGSVIGGVAFAVFAASLLTLGQACLLIATSIFIAAAAISMLVAIGTAGLALIGVAITEFLMLIPLFFQQVGLGIRAFLVVIANSGREFMEAFTTIGIAILDAIDKLAPRLFATFTMLIQGALRTIRTLFPDIVETGWQMVLAFLRGIRDHIGEVIEIGADIIVSVITGLGEHMGEITNAAGDMLIKFLQGITDWINNNTTTINQTMEGLGEALIHGLAAGLTGAATGILHAAVKEVTDKIPAWMRKRLGIESPSKVTKKIGVHLLEGLAKGLGEYSSSGLKKSLEKLSDKVVAGIKKQNEIIARERAKLKEERAKADPNEAVIKQSLKALSEATKAKANYLAVQKKLNGSLKDEKEHLKKLAKDYDKVHAKLKAAQEKLADFYAKSQEVSDSFNIVPDIDANTSVSGYIKTIGVTAEATKKYAATLAKLRKMGLDDDSYNQLLGAGVEGQNFANQLVAGGKKTVSAFNKANQGLENQADKLGTAAAKALYGAGINAALGLVAGLQKQENAIKKQMDKIGRSMVRAIKKELGIKSPSQVLAEVGKFIILGLARGLDKTASVAVDSATGVGDSAVEAMRSSLARLGDVVQADMDMSPVIAPVIDLTQFRKDAAQMGSLIDTSAVTAEASYSQAASVASDQQVALEAVASDASQVGTIINFEQNNHSPESLSTTEIYRQTNNQLAMAKRVVTVPA